MCAAVAWLADDISASDACAADIISAWQQGSQCLQLAKAGAGPAELGTAQAAHTCSEAWARANAPAEQAWHLLARCGVLALASFAGMPDIHAVAAAVSKDQPGSGAPSIACVQALLDASAYDPAAVASLSAAHILAHVSTTVWSIVPNAGATAPDDTLVTAFAVWGVGAAVECWASCVLASAAWAAWLGKSHRCPPRPAASAGTVPAVRKDVEAVAASMAGLRRAVQGHALAPSQAQLAAASRTVFAAVHQDPLLQRTAMCPGISLLIRHVQQAVAAGEPGASPWQAVHQARPPLPEWSHQGTPLVWLPGDGRAPVPWEHAVCELFTGCRPTAPCAWALLDGPARAALARSCVCQAAWTDGACDSGTGATTALGEPGKTPGLGTSRRPTPVKVYLTRGHESEGLRAHWQQQHGSIPIDVRFISADGRLEAGEGYGLLREALQAAVHAATTSTQLQVQVGTQVHGARVVHMRTSAAASPCVMLTIQLEAELSMPPWAAAGAEALARSCLCLAGSRLREAGSNSAYQVLHASSPRVTVNGRECTLQVQLTSPEAVAAGSLLGREVKLTAWRAACFDDHTGGATVAPDTTTLASDACYVAAAASAASMLQGAPCAPCFHPALAAAMSGSALHAGKKAKPLTWRITGSASELRLARLYTPLLARPAGMPLLLASANPQLVHELASRLTPSQQAELIDYADMCGIDTAVVREVAQALHGQQASRVSSFSWLHPFTACRSGATVVPQSLSAERLSHAQAVSATLLSAGCASSGTAVGQAGRHIGAVWPRLLGTWASGVANVLGEAGLRAARGCGLWTASGVTPGDSALGPHAMGLGCWVSAWHTSDQLWDVLRAIADADLDPARGHPLLPALAKLWLVWPAAQRQALITYCTGMQTMPEPGTQALHINTAGLSLSLQDRATELASLPVAHTCSVTLDMPDYWAALSALLAEPVSARPSVTTGVPEVDAAIRSQAAVPQHHRLALFEQLLSYKLRQSMELALASGYTADLAAARAPQRSPASSAPPASSALPNSCSITSVTSTGMLGSASPKRPASPSRLSPSRSSSSGSRAVRAAGPEGTHAHDLDDDDDDDDLLAAALGTTPKKPATVTPATSSAASGRMIDSLLLFGKGTGGPRL